MKKEGRTTSSYLHHPMPAVNTAQRQERTSQLKIVPLSGKGRQDEWRASIAFWDTA